MDFSKRLSRDLFWVVFDFLFDHELARSAQVCRLWRQYADEMIAQTPIRQLLAWSRTTYVLTERGALFSCGSNLWGHSGQGYGNRRFMPYDHRNFTTELKPVKGLANVVITQIAPYRKRGVYAIDREGKTYFWGQRQDSVQHWTAAIEMKLSTEVVVRLFYGMTRYSGVFFLTKNGQLYVADNNNGPTPVPFPENLLQPDDHIEDISFQVSSQTHMTSGRMRSRLSLEAYIRTRNGRIFYRGDSPDCSLGKVNVFTEIPALAEQNIKKLVMKEGGVTCCALTESGDIYVWGGGLFAHFLLGVPGPLRLAVPIRVQRVPRIITDVAFGDQHCAYLVTGGVLYTWGNNHDGQLGLGADRVGEIIMEPTEVTALRGVVIEKIVLAERVTFAISTSGVVYACGRRLLLGLGHGEIECHTPTPIPILNFSSGKKRHERLFSVSDDGKDSFVIAGTRVNSLYSWGSNRYGQLGQRQRFLTSVQHRSPTQIATPLTRSANCEVGFFRAQIDRLSQRLRQFQNNNGVTLVGDEHSIMLLLGLLFWVAGAMGPDPDGTSDRLETANKAGAVGLAVVPLIYFILMLSRPFRDALGPDPANQNPRPNI